jgi:hypothetical protein
MNLEIFSLRCTIHAGRASAVPELGEDCAAFGAREGELCAYLAGFY